MPLSDYIKTADFKAEKHVPVIDAVDSMPMGSIVSITVSVGKSIPHPNTTEHFIGWIALFFKADDEKFAHQIGKVEFSSHGESVEGANKGSVYCEPTATFSAKLAKSGTLTALSYCNIHGLWESSKAVIVTVE